MIVLFALFACRTSADCDAGYEKHDDGLCYATAGDTGTDTETNTDTDTTTDPGTGTDTAVPPPDVDDVLDQLDACLAGSEDGSLDLVTHCADGVCAGQTEAEWAVVLGEPDCYSYYGGYLDCKWSDGIGAYFTDSGDGTPAPTDTIPYFEVEKPFSGGTTDGLGIGVSMSCFYAVFGTPDYASLSWDGESWQAGTLLWSAAGVEVYDYQSKTGYLPDGYADIIYLGDFGSYYSQGSGKCPRRIAAMHFAEPERPANAASEAGLA